MRAGARDRPALHPLHVRHDRPAEGRRARQRRPRGRARVEHAATSTTCTPGEVFWAASDVGWVVGHSYIVYAPLLAGATTVLYEGKPVGTPDAGAFWRVIEQHGVAALFTAPTAIRAIRKEDPEAALLGDRDAAVAAHALPGRRAHRPRHLRLGEPRPRPARDRPLVADRDRLGDGRELPRPRSAARQARLAEPARAGLPHRRPRRRRRRRRGRRAGRHRRAPAAAAGRPADALERRRALRGVVPRALSRAGTSPATAGTSTRTATCS